MAAWLDIETAAARSGFSRKTLYRAIAAGELRAKKVRSRWRITVRDLEGWLQPSTSPAAAVVRPTTVPQETGSRAALRLIEGERR